MTEHFSRMYSSIHSILAAFPSVSVQLVLLILAPNCISMSSTLGSPVRSAFPRTTLCVSNLVLQARKHQLCFPLSSLWRRKVYLWWYRLPESLHCRRSTDFDVNSNGANDRAWCLGTASVPEELRSHSDTCRSPSPSLISAWLSR